MWRLNNILQNNQQFKEEIKRKKHLETSENGNVTYQIYKMKQSNSKKFIEIDAYPKKHKSLKLT